MIYVVAATHQEIELVQNTCSENETLRFGIHGVGMIHATYNLTNFSFQNPSYIIQCGIAGAYEKNLTIGDVVVVKSEMYGDMGAEDINTDLDLFDLQLVDDDIYTNKQLINPHLDKAPSNWKHVKGITVNKCAGREETINMRKAKFQPDIESMEGAALHYVCLKQNIPFFQIRGISNRVELRNKAAWDIPLAIQNAQLATIQLIQHLLNP